MTFRLEVTYQGPAPYLVREVCEDLGLVGVLGVARLEASTHYHLTPRPLETAGEARLGNGGGALARREAWHHHHLLPSEKRCRSNR